MDLRSVLAYAAFSLPIGAFSWWLSGKAERFLRAPVQEDSQIWANLAESLFERHGEKADLSPEKKLRMLLEAGLKRFGLRSAYLFLHVADKSRILSAASESYAMREDLRLGSELKRGQTYCGLLSDERKIIAIDAASLSEWRKHPACYDFGWESYLGAHVSLESGLSASLVFADSRPRDKLYSAAEKEFASGLAKWCGALLLPELGAAKRAESWSAWKQVHGRHEKTV